MAATIRRRLFLGAATLPFLAGLGSPTFAATVAGLSEELRMAEVRLRVARNRYAKGEIPLKYVRDRESEVEAARSALQSAQGGGRPSSAQSSNIQTASASSRDTAALEEELRMAEVRLRVARDRYARREIPLSNVQAREREVEAARAALQGGGRPSSAQSSSNTQTSTAPASSREVAALEEELRMAEVRLRVARDRYAKGQISLRNVEARESEVEDARAALNAAKNGTSAPQAGKGNSNTNGNTSGGGSSQTVTVSDGNQLAYALDRARPGTRIILANNSYSRGGNFVINVDGTSANPIRIEAASTGGASIRSTLQIRGNHVHVSGCKFDGAAVRIERADNCRVSKCTFKGSNGTLVIHGSSNAEVDYNEFSGWSGRCIDFAPVLNGKVGTNPHIHHNYMYSPAGGGQVAISIGQQTGHHSINIRAVVEYNLLEKCKMEQVIRIKSSQNTIQYNTMINCGGMVNRHGRNNKYIGNWLEGCNGLVLSDYNCEGRGNKLIDCSGGLQVMAGDITPSQVEQQEGGHPRSENCQVIGNDANFMRLGRTYGSWKRTLPAVGTTVSGHKGKIGRGSESGTSINSSGASGAGNMARKLSRGQVGV